ncbi:MAG: tetratricopeptide repeat protein [Acidobacteriota bacterium]|nr:tetratricopeptide repeat protein [Acidobacteriota bacterium]
MRQLLALALAALTVAGPAAAQTTPERERARPHNRQGWELMSAESFERAAQSFQQAVTIDNTFEDAFYGLGRAQIALKQYVAAIATLTTCRKLCIAQAGRHFTNQQDAQRYRQDRITEIDEQVRQVQTMPPSPQQQNLLRQLNNQRRDIQNAIARGNDMSIDASVPPWVSLSLGSAYFRSGRLGDAERGAQQPRGRLLRNQPHRRSRRVAEGCEEGRLQGEPATRTGDQRQEVNARPEVRS